MCVCVLVVCMHNYFFVIVIKTPDRNNLKQDWFWFMVSEGSVFLLQAVHGTVGQETDTGECWRSLA